jgi:hypothetical protein
MNAAKGRAHASVFFYEGNATVEIAAAEKYVIKHGGRSLSK